MSHSNPEVPQGAETSAIRSELTDSVCRSALLAADEKEEFVSHLRTFPDEMLGDLATAFSSDAKEALAGVRFHVRFNQVASMISGFETRVQSIGGAVGRMNRKCETAEREAGATNALEDLQCIP